MNLPALKLNRPELSDFEAATQKEWLITNGLGGYASSTVLGMNTRKYHGLLVAALHPPGDRTVCLAKLDEEINVDGKVFLLGVNEFSDAVFPQGFLHLQQFSVSPFPTFVYLVGGVQVKKTVFVPYEKNVTATIYEVQNSTSAEAAFMVTPLVTCRHFHTVLNQSQLQFTQRQSTVDEVELAFDSPEADLSLRATQGEFRHRPNWIQRLFYREEAKRGESSIDDAYQPGYFQVTVAPNSQLQFAVIAAAGTSSQQNVEALTAVGRSTADVLRLCRLEQQRQAAFLGAFYTGHPEVPVSDWVSWVLLAVDSFIVKGSGYTKSVIAGYHWFEAWGRDTFIALPGLLLVPRKFEEAQKVLLGFNRFLKSGLIPNFVSDLSQEPALNTVDATLWYVNAVLQYLKYTGDFKFIRSHLWGSLKEITERHVEGTLFGIGVDGDSLLRHDAGLTWMDAEVNGKEVTSRAGTAVEIQALWYNTLRTMQILADEFGEQNLSESYAQLAEKTQASFRAKFWNSQRNCLFDVLAESGPDASLRPNQVIAASLDFTMLENAKNQQIIDLTAKELWTPCGLRTLEPNDPQFRGTYEGDRSSRDQVYHNGTVWPWLLGPFTTAFLKAKGATAENRSYAAQTLLEPLFKAQVGQAGLGCVSEIFDGQEPHKPRGCISQAWSVAEPLRAYMEDILLVRPKFEKIVLKQLGY